MEILICLVPLLLVGLATYLFDLGLQKDIPTGTTLGFLGLGTLPLLVITYGVFEFARQTGYFGFFLAVFVSIASFCAALWFAWTAPSRRKLFALVLGIIFPAALFQTSIIGSNYSPSSITRQNGTAIAQALLQYKADNGRYPENLTALTPIYLSTIPYISITPTLDWLYESSPDHFTLGYLSGAEGMTVWVCKYSSETLAWNCDSGIGREVWQPFDPVSTPQPTRTPASTRSPESSP